MWNIEKIVKKGDYLYALVKDHPFSTDHGYVLHHRVIVENHLGRLLNKNEIVHHVNGDKKDNKIENLQLMKAKEHAKHHGMEQGKIYVDFRCPSCGRMFSKSRHATLAKRTPQRAYFCSRACNGKFNSKAKIELTTEMKSAISGNIVRQYKVYGHDNPEGTQTRGSVETVRTPSEMTMRQSRLQQLNAGHGNME